MKVFIAEKIADSGTDLLRSEGHEVVDATGLKREELLDRIGEADALIVRSATKADAELFERAPNLKVVGRAGVGLDNVDVEAATRQGVVVVNAPQSNILSAAEHTMALLLAVSRRIPEANTSLRSGKWERSRFEGVELHGKTLAVLGLGRIGTLVAQRAMAFGMRLVAYDPFVSAQRAAQIGVELMDLEDALKVADFVTIHLPKTPETANLLNAERLALLKPEARVINVARGGLVDEQALADAVSSGQIAGAAVDVFVQEPCTESPLFEHDQIVVTPHLGASTTEAQDKAGLTIAEQVAIALRGDLAPYAVNVDAGRELSDVVRPFLPLAETLGKIFCGIAGGIGGEVAVTYHGPISNEDVRVVTLSALKGMLTPVVHEPVTFVNAPLLASERGMQYREEKHTTHRGYANQLEIRAADGTVVSGTVVGPDGSPRITGIYDFAVEMPPGEWMCFLRYDDRPGVIGAIGTILGETQINISDMRVGRQERGGEALMALAVDQPIPPDILERLREGSGAKDAISLEL